MNTANIPASRQARRWVRFAVWTALLAMGLSVASAARAASCESLASLSLPGATITTAEVVPAGAFTMPASYNPPALMGTIPASFRDLPAFCRVAATLKPSADSDIKMEVWLPVAGWNGKFQAVGNGGWAGIISYPALSDALREGYATSSTDTGHAGANGTFALGHHEKVVDFAYRSEHEMTLKAKALIAAFYGKPASRSYWNGCSTGGKQGLTEAQRYPADYDGIVAGAPANYMIHLHAWSVWVAQAVHKTPESYIPPAKYAVIHKAVLDACDTLDGVKDGLLENPRLCRFDPKALECKSGDGPDCLNAAQVEAARQIYSPAINPRTKQEIFPGVERGSEMLWGVLAGPEPAPIVTETFQYVIFKDPKWDYRTLNFDRDIAFADKEDGGLNNAINPNLQPFFSRGGKLLMYHGWNDALIAPGNSLNYFQSVVKAMGGPGKADGSVRLFMAPGMEHCRGGEGPNEFNAMSAIVPWVEQGKAPEWIVASHSTKGKVDRTRPLCPYPQVAKYKGSGSIDDAANFVCARP